MQTQKAVEHLVPASLGHFRRFGILFVLIAVFVSGVTWFVVKQEQNSILSNMEIRLWSEARMRLNAITMWYAPLRQEGLNFSQSDLVRLFTVEAANPARQIPVDRLEYQRAKMEAQRLSMVSYLQRQAEALGLSEVRIVAQDGTDLAVYTTKRETEQEKAEIALVRAAAGQSFVQELPVRKGVAGPLLDVVFPISSLNLDPSEAVRNIGALVFTVPLSKMLGQWLVVAPKGDQRSLVLERRASGMMSVEPPGLVAQEWRGASVLPGAKSSVAPGGPSSMGQITNSGAANEVWRITRYSAPAFNRDGTEEVLGVGMRVPLIDNWYVVMETPFAPVSLVMEKALYSKVLWAVLLGVFSYALFIGVWWWLDGRLNRRLHMAAKEISGLQYKDRYLLEALSSIMPAPLYATNVQGVIKYANDAFALLLGKDRQSLYERNIAETLPSVQSLLYAQYDSELFKTKATTIFTDTWSLDGSKVLNFAVTKKSLCMPDGQLYGIMTMLQGTGPDAYAHAHQKTAQGEAAANVSEHTPSTNTAQQKLKDA